MELKDIDLNLLVVFNQLLAERKVSKVAENLGLGQPAVSNALARGVRMATRRSTATTGQTSQRCSAGTAARWASRPRSPSA